MRRYMQREGDVMESVGGRVHKLKCGEDGISSAPKWDSRRSCGVGRARGRAGADAALLRGLGLEAERETAQETRLDANARRRQRRVRRRCATGGGRSVSRCGATDGRLRTGCPKLSLLLSRTRLQVRERTARVLVHCAPELHGARLPVRLAARTQQRHDAAAFRSTPHVSHVGLCKPHRRPSRVLETRNNEQLTMKLEARIIVFQILKNQQYWYTQVAELTRKE